MEILHVKEEPCSLVLDSLLQAFDSRSLALGVRDPVSLHSRMSEVKLIL